MMLIVFACLCTGGKGEREMIPMNDMGPGKCERMKRIHTTSQCDTRLKG